MDGIIAGFERRRLAGHGGVIIDTLIGGSGPPLLLMHGYPMTRMTFKAVAPRLAETFTLVIPDLRGYGRSDKPAGDDAHELYSKRVMALDMLAVMRGLGFTKFRVAGHDRGARVAYRLALDHGDAVERVVIMDVLPTAEHFARETAQTAYGKYHWYMLAQPKPLPETLIGGDPDFFYRWTLKSWAAKGFEFDAEVLADYLHCFADPASIHASCEDYRAGYAVDRAHDEADRHVRKILCPALVLWGEDYGVAKMGPLEVWRDWAADVVGQAIPGGHFQAEEAPEETVAALLAFLG